MKNRVRAGSVFFRTFSPVDYIQNDIHAFKLSWTSHYFKQISECAVIKTVIMNNIIDL